MTVAAMDRLARSANWIGALAGWRRLLFAFLVGAASATAFAPLNFFPALLLGYGVLVLLIDGADRSAYPVRAAAAAGWAFCFGQFLVGWHWIGYAFLVDPDNHLWQMPLALVSLPAALALYGAFACGIAVCFWQEGAARLLVLAVLLAVGEWLRGHWFTGFPWNLPAYGWGLSLAVLQSASLVGAYGLSFLTILLGASLGDIALRRWRAPTAMALLFVALWTFGAVRLAVTPTTNVPGVSLRLVQPNIPQQEKFVRRLMVRNWERLVLLSIRSDGKSASRPTHIIWPEAATGFPLARSSGALDQIGLFTDRGQSIITGSVRVDRGPDGRNWYNSLYVFGPEGGPGGGRPLLYDKFHLVPFGEYMPYAVTLNRLGISPLAVGEGATPGDHPHLLAVAGAPAMTPLICYEVIFPHAVVDPGAARPGWMVNITDDSWFGPWAGPHQHLLIAQVRAIEEGLPIARAANTGISAVIDPLGRLKGALALNRMGVLNAALPTALSPPLYALFGDLLFLLLLTVAVAGAFGLTHWAPGAVRQIRGLRRRADGASSARHPFP